MQGGEGVFLLQVVNLFGIFLASFPRLLVEELDLVGLLHLKANIRPFLHLVD